MKNEKVYKIEPLPVLIYFSRILSVPIIFLIIYNFSLNPIVFSILLLFPIGIILFTLTSKLILTKETIIVEYNSLIWFISKKTIINISDIRKVEYVENHDPAFKVLLPFNYSVRREPTKVLITLHDNSEVDIYKIGSTKQFSKFLLILSKQIKK